MEPSFDKLDGVFSTTSGYTGGQTANPTYQQVSAGITGHTESVEVLYDPSKITAAISVWQSSGSSGTEERMDDGR